MVMPSNGWGPVRANWAPRVLGMNQGTPRTVGPRFDPARWRFATAAKWGQGVVTATRSQRGVPQGTRPGGKHP
jgi:hypothetical protein